MHQFSCIKLIFTLENKIELASVEKVVEELVDKYPNMNKDEPEKREWMADVPVVMFLLSILPISQ